MKLPKRIKTVAVCLIFIFLFAGVYAFAQSGEQITATITSLKTFLNGSELSLKSPAVTINNKTYVPLRELAEDYFDMEVHWDGARKRVDLYGDTMVNDESLIKAFIYPSSALGLVFKIDLSNDGQLTTTVGKANTFEIINEKSFFTPKVTRYRSLTDTEMDGLKNLISKISDDEKEDERGCDDGWYITINYQNEYYKYVFGGTNRDRWHCSDNMFEIIMQLLEYSPIEIVTYAYDDPIKADYYENLDW